MGNERKKRERTWNVARMQQLATGFIGLISDA